MMHDADSEECKIQGKMQTRVEIAGYCEGRRDVEAIGARHGS